MLKRSKMLVPGWLACTMILAALACEPPLEPMSEVSEALRSPRAVTPDRPFIARFHTDLAAFAPDPACAPGLLLNTQVGEGVATHLGRFTTVITFCVDPTDLLDDGALTEGESLPYTNGAGVLVAANGDQLHIAISGAVLPSTDPQYDFEFHDAFVITGGTGRFVGASGAGSTDSFVDQATNRTTHRWHATLQLP